MSEEIRTDTTLQEMTDNPPESKSIRRIRRTYYIAFIFLAIGIFDSLLQFRDYSAWQILADAAGILLGLIILIISYSIFIRGNKDRAANLIPIVVFFTYAPGDLFLEGVTVYNLISGMLLFALTFFIFRPRKLGTWIQTALIFVATVLAFSQINVFDRFDISVSDSWTASLPIFTIAVTALLIWQVFANLRIRTIRTQLLILFMGIGLIPVVIIAGTSSLLGYQRDRAQTETNLVAIAQLKTEQINSWLASLNTDLSLLELDEDIVSDAEFLINFTLTQEAKASIRQSLTSEMIYVLENNVYLDEIFIVSNRGKIVVSTTPENEDLIFINNLQFQGARYGEDYSPFTYLAATKQLDIFIAHPLKNADGETIGVIMGRANPSGLNAILKSDQQGDQFSNIYLVNYNGILVASSSSNETVTAGKQAPVGLDFENTDPETSPPLRDFTNLENLAAVGISVYIPELETYIAVEQYQSVAFQTLRLNLIITSGLATLMLAVIVFVSVYFSRNLSEPIFKLSQDADKVWHRELNYIEPLNREDEIGELSDTLSKMTEELLQTTTNLEMIVSERTKILERRATYLQTTSEISKALTGIYNLDNLLNTVTYLISENFGFYHVGIFLLDSQNEFAELKAANSEGGWNMLARNHKLKVGEQGIVGYVTSSGKPRIQQQVAGEGSVHYKNPELPLTKSEMALPLKAGNMIFGALDVQSVQEEAFSDEDVSALQALADSVAIAIQNTRLVQQLQESLETERKIYGDLTSSTWKAMLDNLAAAPAFKSDQDGIQPASDTQTPLAQKAIQTGQTTVQAAAEESGIHQLAVPIHVRGGAVVAVIETQKPASSGPWTTEEITILESVSTEMGMAIENARLFEETQRTAQRERISANLSSKIWASTDVENILQTAVRELGSALNVSYGTIKLKLPDESEPNGNHDGVER